MSNLPAVLDQKTLKDKLEEAIDINDKIDAPDGGKMDLPEHVKQSIQKQNIADALTRHISEVAVNLPEVRKTELMLGSGDTGRQSQLYLKPEEDISKDQLRDIATDLKYILENVFPMEFLVGITHKNTVDDEGYPDETDEFYIFLVYRARTRSSPSPPAGDSTEVL